MGKRKAKGNNGKQATNGGRRQPTLVDHISDDSDDEEIPEDEAFNSDDEKKYGSFFENQNYESDDEEDEDDSSDDGDSEDEDNESEGSDDDDDEENGKDLLDLLDRLDDNGINTGTKNDKYRKSMVASHVKESAFSASVVPKAGLTLDNLMEEIKDSKGFGSVQKSMKSVALGKATAAPVAHSISERTKRQLHYKEQTEEVSLWMDAVKQNRQAETLDFRPKDRLEITRDVMIEKFVPTTDFEKQINAALEEAGQQDEEEILRKEEQMLKDDLGANAITLEEYKRRHGQLAKMRALMFYFEQKRHHINKIKSKKYRKIRKRQREKQRAAETEGQLEIDPDLARELAEKEEVERMKERMTLAHKNTSKWAKRVLKRGKNMDIDTRRALSAQLQRGDDLLKRMNATRNGNDSDDDVDDKDLIDSARKVLADTEEDDPVQRAEEEASGLFKLAFMKKGIEKQREMAKQEARQLLLELEANDEENNAKNDSGSDDGSASKTKDSAKEKKLASKKEMKQVLQDGEMVATSLKFGNAITMTGSIEIDAISEVTNSLPDKKSAGQNVSEHVSTFSIVATQIENNHINSKLPKRRDPPQPQYEPRSASRTNNDKDECNPWLLSDQTNDDSPKDQPIKTTRTASSTKTKIQGFVDVDRAIDLLESTPTTKDQRNSSENGGGDKSNTSNGEQQITMLTQEELVRKAFSAISEQEAEEEFAQEKALVEEEEDPTRKVKKEKAMQTTSGWGSWTGAGAPPPLKQRKLPPHLQAPVKKELPKRKRVDESKPNVIISQKRCKKLADNYMITNIPYPYTSREEYERAMAGGIGREWNVSGSFKDMIRPEVLTRPGKIIQPISKRVKTARAPAKF